MSYELYILVFVRGQKVKMLCLTSLLHRYPEAFHIPGSPLGIIKGFYHNIDTGESPPIYKLPYRKSKAELLAIKAELEQMLALNIICPSHSAWGGGGGLLASQ